MDFKRVSIKRPSERVISRMRNGHSVRMMKGDGLDIMLKPAKIMKMAKKFIKGTGIQISLDPDEIMANKEVEGCGIFGKKADKFMEKKGIKKAVYAVGSVAKPFVQEGIKAAEAMAIAYGVPPTIASKIGDTAAQYVDDPESLQGKKGLQELKRRGIELGQEGLDMVSSEFGVDKVDLAGIVKKATPKKAQAAAQAAVGDFRRGARAQMGGARQSLADKLEARFSDVPSGQGLYVGRGIGLGVIARARKAARMGSSDVKDILSSTKDKLKDSVADLERQVRSAPEMLMEPAREMGMMGQGMKSGFGRAAKFAERSIMGRNALIGGAMSPALMSQPYSENYQFRATLGLSR
jgi:hypothetical protein